MKICMIGTGYVGLVSGACFADLGNTVYCVDKNKNKIDMLNRGNIPIYEPGLSEIVKKNYNSQRLKFTTDLKKAVRSSDVIFICVGTPNNKKSGSANLSHVFNVAQDISKNITKFKIIVCKSTVPLATGDKIEKIILKKVKKSFFEIVSNPEFLREGDAIRDFRFPDRIVIGSNNKKIIKKIESLYEPLVKKGAKLFFTNRRGAELIKYASNAFLATKISFINEISNLCEVTNVNVEDISLGMGMDKRIGDRFLRAGPAYGGSCFPKDTQALTVTGDQFRINLSIIKSVIKSNKLRKEFLLGKIKKILNGKVKNKNVVFLGVTFKANTDDMRESSSLTIIPKLLKMGAKIKYYDPSGFKDDFSKYKNITFCDDITTCCSKADLIIIHTEWDEFKSIDFKKLTKNKNLKIYDMRNLYSPNKMKKLGLNYFSIGR
jgi:UDPglucose 6-dehydrogenase